MKDNILCDSYYIKFKKKAKPFYDVKNQDNGYPWGYMGDIWGCNEGDF